MIWCYNFYSKECNTTNPNICTSCVSYSRELIDGHCRCKNNWIDNAYTGDCLQSCPPGMLKIMKN